MKRISCPYLGLKDDPTTALGFPSPGNFCHQGRPIAPVKGAYQEKYCLTDQHAACPIYQAARPVPLPAAIAARPGPLLNGRQILALLGVPAVIVAAAAIFYAWNTFGSRFSLSRQIPNTGQFTGDFNFRLLGGQQQTIPTLTPLAPLVGGSSVQTPTATCPRPENWVPYTINPTDSLFRLSVIYGVSIDELQKANCMGSNTLLVPGQVIYIPFIPTDTPISTDTPVPQAPVPANIQPPALPAATNTPTSAPPPKKTPTKTPITATNTPAPTDTPAPTTNTPAPTNTPVPPTDTPPPTNTPVPPTNTPAPTSTPMPPTNTPTPTDTPIPPTSTIQPSATLGLQDIPSSTPIIPSPAVIATNTPVPPAVGDTVAPTSVSP